MVPSALPFVLPLFRNTFSSRTSPQPFKIETSYLIYKFTTTSCIAGLQVGILLFDFSCVCSFFFLSIFFVKDISTTVSDRNFKFSLLVYNDILYRRIENKPSTICSSFFFLFIIYIKDICTTVLDRNFKFGIQVYNKLCRGIENGPSPISSSLYLFSFLSLQIFRQRYLHTRLIYKLQ